MREIKFRVWLIKEKKLVDVAILDLQNEQIKYQYKHDDLITSGREFLRNVVLEQYTGLKDQNGKEIYEGDIIRKVENVENPRTHNYYKKPRYYEDKGVVEFHDGCFDFTSKKYRGQMRCYYRENTINFEVIGNIHDNPELLKE